MLWVEQNVASFVFLLISRPSICQDSASAIETLSKHMASDPMTRTTSSCQKSELHTVAACSHVAVVSDLKSRLRVAKPIAQDLDQEDGFAWCDLRSESFTEAPDGLQFGWHPSMLQSV